MSEYVESKLKEWKDKYNFPEHYEFQLKTLFELEDQYNNTNKDHVKTKRELFEMIHRSYRSIPSEYLKEKPKPNKDPYIILIAVKDVESLMDVCELLRLIKPICSIDNPSKKFTRTLISANNDIFKVFVLDNEVPYEVRGQKGDIFINLTRKNEHNDILKSMCN